MSDSGGCCLTGTEFIYSQQTSVKNSAHWQHRSPPAERDCAFSHSPGRINAVIVDLPRQSFIS